MLRWRCAAICCWSRCRFIVLGFSLNDRAILLVGAIPVALLAFAAEIGLSNLQRWLQPRTPG